MKILKKFIDFESSDPKVINRSKNLVAIGSFSIFAIVIMFVLLSSEKKNIKINHKLEKIDIASSLNINPEDEWISKSENDLEIFQKKYDELFKEMESLKKQREEDKRNYGQIIDSLALQIANTEAQVSNNQNITDEQIQYNEYGEVLNNNFNSILTISIDLDDNNEIQINDSFKELENYIPAGSYAKARMLSGADVSTGVNNQSDPNNMMFEITSPVYAPKYKGNVQEIKKVEGCRVMGAAVGQLWTEKAYIRLLKMTCSFEKGKVIEYNVKGYVTSFAKEGVRGKVVSREGYFTSMAFLAGAVEGLADITKVAYSPTLEVSTGLATETIKTSDVAKQAGSSGLGKAAEMLSEYYIDRAEQYQSVIDVPTGIEVEIVFQEGIDLKTNTSFKVKQNEISKQIGTQVGQDINSYNSNSNVYINNNGVF